MNDILRALLEMEGFRIEAYLEKEQIDDLTAIQYRLGEGSATVCMTRTVDAFLNLIGAVCSGERPLRIHLEKGGRPDMMSLEVIHLLQTRCGKTLEVIMK